METGNERGSGSSGLGVDGGGRAGLVAASKKPRRGLKLAGLLAAVVLVAVGLVCAVGWAQHGKQLEQDRRAQQIRAASAADEINREAGVNEDTGFRVDAERLQTIADTELCGKVRDLDGAKRVADDLQSKHTITHNTASALVVYGMAAFCPTALEPINEQASQQGY